MGNLLTALGPTTRTTRNKVFYKRKYIKIVFTARDRARTGNCLTVCGSCVVLWLRRVELWLNFFGRSLCLWGVKGRVLTEPGSTYG